METSTVYVHGTDKFRCMAIFGSLIAGTFNLLIKAVDPRSCDQVKLENAIYILFGVHLGTFLILLASYTCPKCIMKLGRGMGIFYFFLVGAMCCVQVIYFHGQNCGMTAPILYYWISLNIFSFYVLIAYGLSLWGAYICWEVDEEEKLVDIALKTQISKQYGQK